MPLVAISRGEEDSTLAEQGETTDDEILDHHQGDEVDPEIEIIGIDLEVQVTEADTKYWQNIWTQNKINGRDSAQIFSTSSKILTN